MEGDKARVQLSRRLWGMWIFGIYDHIDIKAVGAYFEGAGFGTQPKR